jgi:uncharacterized 2Fe-2S/4Fe-4S cluster protein (DUF4445 family)
MKYSVRIHNNDKVKQVYADEATNILQLLRENGIDINTPCGGRGICGKCAVRVYGLKSAPDQSEMSHLEAEKLAKGYRLACLCKVDSDIDIYVDNNMEQASIVTEIKNRKISPAPIIKKQYIEMKLKD